MNFKPQFPDFRKKVEQSFNQQKFMAFINAKLLDVQPGYCEISIPFHENLTQQNGFFHAGIISTIADNTAGYACFSLMDEQSSILTVEFKINLLSPGNGDLLIGKAHVLKKGKTLSICRSEVFTRKNGKEKLCAAAQATLIELKKN